MDIILHTEDEIITVDMSGDYHEIEEFLLNEVKHCVLEDGELAGYRSTLDWSVKWSSAIN